MKSRAGCGELVTHSGLERDRVWIFAQLCRKAGLRLILGLVAVGTNATWTNCGEGFSRK